MQVQTIFDVMTPLEETVVHVYDISNKFRIKTQTTILIQVLKSSFSTIRNYIFISICHVKWTFIHVDSSNVIAAHILELFPPT
ncbi:predicted protein [Chaetoceros tenuissimus]|uniref:Uncharacterized protein n=1 Tax=Chaetoceros tenuissimus TaxID=426638 RepID=A0AAD3GYL3_9STRA|nr:predicted protein [Chaetoceros tenuissimus]